ncbi:cytochrome-c oxidase [Peribacillus cavernae]|uniref:cytochrome-c oxidase n=1 Tax=Peribacillus cavernae TaxID=1674310 RepID=UPI001FE9B899|nr:cytochrome-c oxidase [Peribacillus cavernae]MDQ0219289.1 heme/copper-type cytochrome/quinol oxidase subunit 1 [Peribacillus cavernae]
MFMSISHKFQYRPSLALAGIVYHLFPVLAQKRIGKLHFWLHNLGMPVMLLGLVLLESGNSAVEPFIAIGATIMSIGIICFVINVLVNLKSTPAQSVANKDIAS